MDMFAVGLIDDNKNITWGPTLDIPLKKSCDPLIHMDPHMAIETSKDSGEHQHELAKG